MRPNMYRRRFIRRSVSRYTVSILTKHLSDRISDKRQRSDQSSQLSAQECQTHQGMLSTLRRVPRGVMMVERFLQMQPEDVDEVCCAFFMDPHRTPAAQ